MATIKSFSDLEQSRKLAEILPLESADMSWVSNGLGKPFARTIPIKGDPEELCACWSLAALLGVLPILDNRSPIIPKTFDGKYRVTYHSTAYEKAILTSDYDNPVDACVTMIERLQELKML